MIDLAGLRKKAVLLAGYIDELEDCRAIPVGDYLANSRDRRIVERIIELIIECAVDINNALLFEARQPTPSGYYASFMNLVDAGVVKASLAKRLAPVAGLRNRLAHDYEDVDDSIVHANIQYILRDFPLYLRAVHTRIEEIARKSGEI